MAHKLVESVQAIAVRRTFKQFASKYHLVYFGRVSAQADDHEMVMGVTASTKHTDDFFTVGSFEGHDVTMLVRKNTLVFPGMPDSTYSWLIAQIDLKREFPHIFIDFHHHDKTFFANMAVGFRHMQDMSPAFSDLGARVLVDPLQYGQVRMILSPHVVADLKQHFHTYSLEIKDDQLFVYTHAARPSLTTLEHTLKLATWLAGQLNQVPKIESTS